MIFEVWLHQNWFGLDGPKKERKNLEWVMNRCELAVVLDPFGVRNGTDCDIWSARLVNLDFGEPVPGQA